MDAALEALRGRPCVEDPAVPSLIGEGLREADLDVAGELVRLLAREA